MSADGLDVAVVGAGIVGVSCALFLQADGHRVTLIDRAAPGEGTSFGNAGVLSASSILPIATPGTLARVPSMLLDRHAPLRLRWTHLPRMANWLRHFVQASRPGRVEMHAHAIRALVEPAGRAHDRLIQRCGAGDLVRSGGAFKLACDAAFFDQTTRLERHFLERYDIPHAVLSGDEVREHEPAVSDAVVRGLHLEANRRVTSPVAYTRRMVETFLAEGGCVRREEVWGLDLMDGTGLVTASGRHPFDRVVIAAGAFSKKLAAEAGHRVPLDTERGYHVEVPLPAHPPVHAMQALEHGFFMAPLEHGLRITSGVELAGLRAAPDYSIAERLVPLAGRYVRGLEDTVRSRWLGFRPSLPDGLPVIGASRRHPQILFAFGHQHIGLTLGPITGRIVADLVAGRDPGIDLGPYAPDRTFH
ncbi:MAG: FAD-dependent oxidoreductase [Geminicoccaceae bacterium]|nr:FAD-dependent oxidoreductase [Geminicoccaceae bacterium]